MMDPEEGITIRYGKKYLQNEVAIHTPHNYIPRLALSFVLFLIQYS